MYQKIILFCICLLSLSACSSDQNLGLDSSSKTVAISGYLAGLEDDVDISPPATSSPPSPNSVEPKIIRRATVTMEIKDFASANVDIHKITNTHDAEITHENETKDHYKHQSKMRIRCLPNRFDSLISDITKLGIQVNEKTISSEDVTRQFVDLETRLANKRKVVKRYQELLSKAKTVEEILKVENNLRQVTEEIEAKEGELKYLRSQVGRSTLILTFFQSIEHSPSASPSFGQRIVNSFSNGWQLIQEITLGVITLWPVVLILIGGIFAFRRWRRKRKKA